MITTMELHVLTVHPDPRRPDDPDLYEFTVECPGVTDLCRMYEDCQADDAEAAALQQAVDNGDEPVAHGKRHRHIGGTWMAETPYCYVKYHDGLPDAVAGRFGPGRHPIRWDSGDGTEMRVRPA